MENTTGRSVRVAQTFDASIEQVWAAFTEPEHVVKWWGPEGFTSTIITMDFREGGEWKLTLHGPDGTSYPNRSIFKEIVAFNKIVFEHFNPKFETILLFESQGKKTKVDWTLLFDTVELRETVVKAHNAEAGQRQTLEKLGNYLT